MSNKKDLTCVTTSDEYAVAQMVAFKYRDKTLRAIQLGPKTATQLYARDSERHLITILAINQRLRRLHQAGLAMKIRIRGNSFRYRITTKGKKLLQRQMSGANHPKCQGKVRNASELTSRGRSARQSQKRKHHGRRN